MANQFTHRNPTVIPKDLVGLLYCGVSTMKKRTKSTDPIYEFWKKYEEADFLKRRDLLKPIIKNFHGIVDLEDKKVMDHTLSTMLQSYFDDLLEYCQQKSVKK